MSILSQPNDKCSNLFSVVDSASCKEPKSADSVKKSNAGGSQKSSRDSLSNEGFSKKKEAENDKMWKMVETLRGKSSLLRGADGK